MSGKERHFVEEAFKSNYVAPTGPMVDAFEKSVADYCGISHTVALSSGTAAIHLALKCLDLPPGSEVWASSLTFIGSIAPAIYEGMKPVFIDVNSADWTMDCDLLRAELRQSAKANRLPGAIIPTDLYGQSCDLDTIAEAAAEFGVPVIADSAEAMGARYKDRHAGDGALVAIFSFNGNKIITSSGGGILASHDEKIAHRARYLSTQARQPFPHYEHTEVGYNYRLSNICAAIGRGQMEVLDDRVKQRRAIFELYRSLLSDVPGISFMPEASYGRCTRWLTVILVERESFGLEPEDIRLKLEEENIESRPLWKPMHLQPVFRNERVLGGRTSEELFKKGLCLPSGTELSGHDVERIATAIRRIRTSA
jgi:dTDP-4-amino-4,6-dideoxygalactose transaminase